MISFHIMLKWISSRLCVFSSFFRFFMLQIYSMNLIGMVKHSQISQNCKFAMSIQYLRKELRDEIDFLHQINIKVSTSWQYRFWWKWPDMSKVPNRKVVIFLEYIKKMSQLLLCFIVMQNIQISFGGPVMFVVTC